jgi:hypothetical protein
LTIDRVDSKHERAIDNLCVKYSILHDRKRSRAMSVSVDVDFLVKNYIRSKSIKEEKRKSRAIMRREISQIACRH